MVLGKLFLQNYRTFSMQDDMIVLYRRINNITNYLFAVLEPPGRLLNKHDCCLKCMEVIRKFSPDRPNSIRLLFVHLNSLATSEFASNNLGDVQVDTYRLSPANERDLSM